MDAPALLADIVQRLQTIQQSGDHDQAVAAVNEMRQALQADVGPHSSAHVSSAIPAAGAPTTPAAVSSSASKPEVEPLNPAVSKLSAQASVAVEPTVPTVHAGDPPLKASKIPQSTPSNPRGDRIPAAPTRGRNLIVCIDGTSNQFSTKNTNVVELYHRLIKDEHQITFYNSGIGTYATPSWKSWKYYKQVLLNKIDLAIAWNFEGILLSAYLWLSENYREGDKIYLFGFSRGAYQVRALSAMIDSVGLLYKGNQDQIPFAYQLYAETKKFEKVDNMRRRFKETFSWTIQVEFVGVWDTVSSVGLVRNKTLPGTTDGMKHVTYFRHALALHDRRVKFLPENTYGGSGPKEVDINTQDGSRPHTKEVWFAGSHSDIGGGAVTNEELNKFGPALRWMSVEAELAGVRLKDAPQSWEPGSINNSLTMGWKIFEVIPFTRLKYRGPSATTYRPHLGRPRKIQPHQFIHETALAQELPRTDAWRARLPDGVQWNNLHALKLVEADQYTAAETVFQQMRNSLSRFLSNVDAAALRRLISTDVGRRSVRDIGDVRDVLFSALSRCLLTPGDEDNDSMLRTAAVIIMAIEQCRLYNPDAPHPDARACAERLAVLDNDLAFRLMEVCSSLMIGRPFRHESDVRCVAFFPSGDRVVTGSDDGMLRIWDLSTGEIVGEPIAGHPRLIRSVAVSPDGKCFVTGASGDENVLRVWDAESRELLNTLEGHTGDVNSISFSHDGSRFATGSDDNTIRIWDGTSGKTALMRLSGHTSLVWAVDYSVDGSYIVSGSRDNTLRVWDAKTGTIVWTVQTDKEVVSAKFSPDGERIVSGSDDATVRVWDAHTGALVLGPLNGHTGWSYSVAFSPDGKRIVSGSLDRTIRLWDAESGQVLEVLTGHQHNVLCVVFSPDGKRIASASEDSTVRIWDTSGEWRRWGEQPQ